MTLNGNKITHTLRVYARYIWQRIFAGIDRASMRFAFKSKEDD